jgi:hypothetical protein
MILTVYSARLVRMHSMTMSCGMSTTRVRTESVFSDDASDYAGTCFGEESAARINGSTEALVRSLTVAARLAGFNVCSILLSHERETRSEDWEKLRRIAN